MDLGCRRKRRRSGLRRRGWLQQRQQRAGADKRGGWIAVTFARTRTRTEPCAFAEPGTCTESCAEPRP